MTTRHPHATAHHHPSVHRIRDRWVWDCRCGGSSCRTLTTPRSWREVVIEALLHSGTLAP